ncbi:MAG: nitroreductase family deazaflavin-dependent oxidoreductase [Solirubrobacteraceae bacterium]
MPLKLSRRVARFNRAVNNPIQGQWAWLLPPWAIICHHGRRTGRRHRTPVLAFKRGATLSVGILYGEESDWVRNLLAGGGEVVRGGRTFPLHDPRVVRMDATVTERLSPLARAYGRLSGIMLVAELGDPRPGYGRGPQAAPG